MDNTFRAITVQVKDVYGKEVIYPLCPDSIIFCELLNQKTLTENNIYHIKKLGYTVLVEPTTPRQL